MKLPATFGNYELLERIATGGMAEVFLARSFGVEGFEKRVVIKRILPSLARAQRFVDMFVREAKISALLSHPNIVQTFDLGRVGEDHFIAMEHIHGQNLTQTVRRLRSQGERLPLPLSVHAAASLARGLSHAHSRLAADGSRLGIIHRDVSPHNVMVSYEGEVKLVDFGIARLSGEMEQYLPGKPGGGKFAYMSPEQALGGAIDHRSDIFSCGIVLYELLVNHRLFQDQDPEEKLRRVREAIVPDPREEVPEIPQRLWEILQRALARDPEDRYAEASHLEEDLRALLFESGQRADDAVMGAFMRELFADEMGPDPAASQLGDLVLGLGAGELRQDSDYTGTAATGSLTGSGSLEGEAPVAERKPVGVVVAEMLGHTQPSAQLEPEEVLARHRRVRRLIERAVTRHGGWLDRVGDEFLVAYFGVPRTHEDDLDRALSCARRLLRTRSRMARGGLPLDFAVGVHRGEVVWVGEKEERSCLPRGDTVKLTRRLASAAEGGQILVSEEVASAAAGWRFSGGPRLRGRGSREAIRCFTLDGPRSKEVGGSPGRWLARGNEIEVLGEYVSALAQGRGGSVAISGPGGSGKSRLVRELRELAQRAGAPFYGGRAQPRESDRPMSALRELVAAGLGIRHGDRAEVIRQRLGRLSELNLPERDISSIAALFALEWEPGFTLTREDMMAAAVRLVRGLARERPVVLVLEDVHDLRDSELDLVSHLLKNRGGDPVLWLLTHRDPWPQALPSPDATVALGIMDREQHCQMVCELLGVDRVSPGLRDMVVRTAAGNPLYLVEVVKALLRSKQISVEAGTAALAQPDAEPTLPASLDALISARVDALEGIQKRSLQIAAAIGPSFSEALLRSALDVEDPDQVIAALLTEGLLLREGAEDPRLSFASQLVWDGVKGSTLGAQLREHHRRVAEGIESLHEGHLEPHYENLAKHCAAGGRFLDAARYADRAGDLHLAVASLEGALHCYRQGIAHLEADQDLEQGPNLEGVSTLHMKAGEVCEHLGDLSGAERHLQLALDVAEEGLFHDISVGALFSLGRVYTSQGKMDLGRAHLEQALTEARVSDLVRRQVEILLGLGMLDREEGEVSAAFAHYESAQKLAEGDAVLTAKTLVGLANLYNRLGEEERALETLRAAREVAEESEERFLIIQILTNTGTVHYGVRRYTQAQEWFRQALELSEAISFGKGQVLNRHNLADAHFRMEESARAFTGFTASRDRARELGMERMVALNEVYLGYLLAERGEPEAGRELLGQAIGEAARMRDGETVLVGQWLEGRLYCDQGDLEKGFAVLREALEAARAVQSELHAREIEGELARWVC